MPTTKSFLLLYASQTGQAKAIAEEIQERAPTFGLEARLFCLSLTDRKFSVEKETCVVFIVSTTGDGEPPDSAIKFFRRLNRQTLPKTHLKHLHYTLLALGDSNYIKFCLFGRQLDSKLKELSANPFYPTGYGDDAFGIETGVDPWMDNLWPALQKQLGVDPTDICKEDNSPGSVETNRQVVANNIEEMQKQSPKETTAVTVSNISPMLLGVNVQKCKVPKLPAPTISLTFDKDLPIRCRHFFPSENGHPSQASALTKVNLIAARRLTRGEHVKKTLQLTFRFQDKMDYLPGDSFGFFCENSWEEVHLLLLRLKLTRRADDPLEINVVEGASQKKLPTHIPPLLSLKQILLHCVEIRSVPKKVLLRVMAEHTALAREREALLFLSSADGSKFYTDCIRKPQLCVLDILLRFPSCSPPVEALLEYLPSLKPRFYSVSSSPLEDPSTFCIVFNVVEIEEGEGRMCSRKGVCTGWLDALSSKLQDLSDASLDHQMSRLDLNPEKLDIILYRRQNTHFRFPEDPGCPLIMVGPGTGVAPFIGFLKHREKQNCSSQELWLFYGCRYRTLDYLFRDELQRFHSRGILTHLVESFSREESPGVATRYVHESIRQNAAPLYSAVSRGGRILVCGDAGRMSRDVQQAFVDAFHSASGMTEAEAETFVLQMQADHRYVNDVWT